MKNKSNNKEKGSALLFTLGILSLALILAMSFAFSARTSRQVARINADQVKARMIAESGLERVLALLKYGYEGESSIYLPCETNLDRKKQGNASYHKRHYTFNNSNSGTSADYSQSYLVSIGGNDKTGATFGSEDETAKTLLGIGSESPFLPLLKHAVVCDTNFGFHNIKSNGINIDGRVAWIVIEEANKIDVNQSLTLEEGVSTGILNNPFMVKDDIDSGKPASLLQNSFNKDEDYYHNLANVFPPSDEISESNTVRLGLSMQELHLADDFKSKLPNFTRSSRTKYIPWGSYRQLKNEEQATESNLKKYTIFSDYDIEAYWDGTTEKQRFDLSGFEWRVSTDSYYDADFKPDVSNANNVTGWSFSEPKDASDLVNALIGTDARPDFYSDPVKEEISTSIPKQSGTAGEYTYGTGFGIPHLNGISDEKQRKQIAANMVDFCDGDFYATVDSEKCYPFDTKKDEILSSDEWDSYWGNEAVPYFEEFAIKITVAKSAELEGDDAGKCNINVSFEPFLDMFQINCTEGTNYFPAGKAVVRVYGTVTLKRGSVDLLKIVEGYKDMEWGYGAGTSDAPVEIIAGNSTLTKTASSSKVESGSQKVLLTETIKLTYTIDKIVMLSYDETEKRYFDFAVANAGISGEINVMEAGAIGDEYVCSWQVKDIRLNHKKDQWEITTTKETTPTEVKGLELSGSDNINSPRSDYATLASDTSCDKEDYSSDHIKFNAKDKTFTTAFIPNRPFKSIWELGALHRGEAFRTVSLMGDDKEICDQVKIGPFKQVRGKFNCNTRNPDAWKELLKNIEPTKAYWEVASSEGDFDFSVDINDVPLSTKRSDTVALFEKLNASTLFDAQAEALFGRTVGLLSTRNDKYTILIAAQALQELPDVPVDSKTNFDAIKGSLVNPIVYEAGTSGDKMAYSILATQKLLAQVCYNTWRKNFKIMQLYYVEE